MVLRERPHATFQRQLLTASKLECYIEDLMILKNICYSTAVSLKKKIIIDLGGYDKVPYPLPMEETLGYLNIDIKKLELAAMREKKLGISINEKDA